MYICMYTVQYDILFSSMDECLCSMSAAISFDCSASLQFLFCTTHSTRLYISVVRRDVQWTVVPILKYQVQFACYTNILSWFDIPVVRWDVQWTVANQLGKILVRTCMSAGTVLSTNHARKYPVYHLLFSIETSMDQHVHMCHIQLHFFFCSQAIILFSIVTHSQLWANKYIYLVCTTLEDN